MLSTIADTLSAISSALGGGLGDATGTGDPLDAEVTDLRPLLLIVFLLFMAFRIAHANGYLNWLTGLLYGEKALADALAAAGTDTGTKLRCVTYRDKRALARFALLY